VGISTYDDEIVLVSKKHDCPFKQKYVLLSRSNVARILISKLHDQQSNLTFICTVTLVTSEVSFFIDFTSLYSYQHTQYSYLIFYISVWY